MTRMRFIVTAVILFTFILLYSDRATPQGAFNPYSDCTFDGQFLGLRTAQTPPWRCLDTGFPAGGQIGIFLASGGTGLGTDTTSSVGTYGESQGSCATGGGTTATAPTSTEPLTIDRDTGTSNANICIQSNLAQYMSGKGLSYQGYHILSSTSEIRWWHGFVQNIDSTMAGSDNPGGDYAAFRYSNGTGGAGDTNYQCITKDNTTQTVTDSGVAADTSGHLFAIIENPGTSYKFYIDGVLKCTNATHLPRTNQLMRIGFGGRALNSTAKLMRMSWMIGQAAN